MRARKDTLIYRATKFTRRHRFGVAASALILALIASYAFTTRAQAERIASERDKAEEVAAFLGDLFKRADPFETADSMTVRQVLERGAAQIEEDLADQPMTMRTHLSLARFLHEQHRYAEAEALLRQALAIQRRRFGDEHDAVQALLKTLEELEQAQAE